MSTLSFSKFEGLGNDFLVVDDREERFDSEDSRGIERLCHRKFGVGADGLLLLQNDKEADFRMRIFNADGKEAASCGNGLRCLLLFIHQELKIFKSSYAIRTNKQIVHGYLDGKETVVNMGAPTNCRLFLKSDWGDLHFIDSGVPHAALFLEDVPSLDVALIGPKIRHHPYFSPEGANVNFVSYDQEGSLTVRTFERGVEGETLACGTGAIAAAAICQKVYPLRKKYRAILAGGVLEIEDKGGDFWMKGPARKVFDGRLETALRD